MEGDAARFEFERPGVRPVDVVSRPSRRSWLRWLFWTLLLLAIIGAAIWHYPKPETQPKTGGRNQFGGPVPVGVATVQRGDMPVTLTGLGTVVPLATVTVKTQINGYLTEAAFQEGQMVKKGDFLAQIDPRRYQVALEQAEGQLAKDQALLKNAQLDLQRYNTLVAQNSIARQTRDTQVSLVAQDQAAIKTDQAQIDAQKLNLVYAHIISPVTGRVGLRQVELQRAPGRATSMAAGAAHKAPTTDVALPCPQISTAECTVSHQSCPCARAVPLVRSRWRSIRGARW